MLGLGAVRAWIEVLGFRGTHMPKVAERVVSLCESKRAGVWCTGLRIKGLGFGVKGVGLRA